MSAKEYNGRRWEIYFPSEQFLKEWKAEAEKARMSLSSWIFETVETNRAVMSEASRAEDRTLEAVREENRRLRKELERTMADLERQKTEAFKLRNDAFIKNSSRGQYDQKLIEVLKRGGSWPSRELLQELDVSPTDSDAMQIVIKQLQMLQDLGFVREGVKGWCWL